MIPCYLVSLRGCIIRLILVRHGETIWNQQFRIQGGSSDTNLSKDGIDQARRLGVALKDIEIDAIYSSPLKRALDTARAIASQHGMDVHIEPAFKEMEVGDLEGVPIAELGTNFSKYMIEWRQGEGTAKLPGGESLIDLSDRVWASVKSIKGDTGLGNVILVSHYFVTVAIICRALGMPVTQIGRIRVQNASISAIDFGDTQPCLVSLGDICHLREGWFS